MGRKKLVVKKNEPSKSKMSKEFGREQMKIQMACQLMNFNNNFRNAN